MSHTKDFNQLVEMPKILLTTQDLQKDILLGPWCPTGM